MNKIDAKAIKKILLIRRDNIGDLICTTPAIHALREKFPSAKIGILVNSYNAGALANNPDVDEVYIYEKEKHFKNRNRLSVWLKNLKLLFKIRKERYDVAVGCGSHSPRLERYTFLTGAKVRIGYLKAKRKFSFYNKGIISPSEEMHEVVKTFALIKPLGIEVEPGGLILSPSSSEQSKFKDFKTASYANTGRPLAAVAISARIKKNKWPIAKFITLIEKLLAQNTVHVLLLWSPGSMNSPTFPGDDEAADIILRRFAEKVRGYPTSTLGALVAAISLSDMVITLDTGSLHIAAALKKPTVALMTRGKAQSWYPWKTQNIALTSGDNVENISVDDVADAVNTLAEIGKRGNNIS
ncbi:MAG: glycosyltransferase family 9 protein [Deltaproteobacteria bacterium]|nr:glycosyltransferase family 9 protein [Deltaproteobacteria bacterium]